MGAEQKIEAGTMSAALVAALAEIGGAAKDKINPAFKSKYADLGSVIDAIKPVLAAHGLAFTQHTTPSEDGVMVETFVRHSGGEKESLGSFYVPANKRDAQGFGSALTYARRYSLMTAFGVPAEDDDGSAATKSAPKADPAPVKRATDAQCALIQTLAPAVGKPLGDILLAYEVGALDSLTEQQAAAVVKRLQAMPAIKENA